MLGVHNLPSAPAHRIVARQSQPESMVNSTGIRSQFSGFTNFCQDFPYDFVEKKASMRDSGLSMAYIAISKVSDQIQKRVFTRPLAHKAKLELVRSRLSSLQTQ